MKALDEFYYTKSRLGIVRSPGVVTKGYQGVRYMLATRPERRELKWIRYLLEETPNGKLFLENDMKQQIEGDEDILLVHVTTGLDAIKASGLLYPSVGCLGATVFSVPLAADGTLHNFTQYIIDHEIPTLAKLKVSNMQLIGIKLKRSYISSFNRTYHGFNYLYLGPMQYDAYQLLKSCAMNNDNEEAFDRFEAEVHGQIKAAESFLLSCRKTPDQENQYAFLNKFVQTIEALPVLGNFYFETLSEYIQLFQQDPESLALIEKGELNIRHFKDVVYELSPVLSEGFDLEKFHPSIEDTVELLRVYSKERKLFPDFNEHKFMSFMATRLAQSIDLKLLGGRRVNRKGGIALHKSLSGHIIHRLIGEVDYMADLLLEYDTVRARMIWDDWLEHDIAVVDNAVLPRGEVGINPCLPEEAYTVHLLRIDSLTKKVIIAEDLQLRISQTLFNGKNLMGSNNNPKKPKA